MADNRREFLAGVLLLTLAPFTTAPPAQAQGRDGQPVLPRAPHSNLRR
jgi:hypothetical protein